MTYSSRAARRETSAFLRGFVSGLAVAVCGSLITLSLAAAIAPYVN